MIDKFDTCVEIPKTQAAYGTHDIWFHGVPMLVDLSHVASQTSDQHGLGTLRALNILHNVLMGGCT